MNVALNLGRAQVLRTVAKWLDANPSLPIRSLTFDEDGGIEVTPSSPDDGVYGDERRVRGLYALAEMVGATVDLTPAVAGYPYGWHLTATWTVGVVPMTARVRLEKTATDVRAIPAIKAARKAS